MSDAVNEFLESVDVADGAVPSDDALRGLSGLNRVDATELLATWDEWPVDVVRDTVRRLGEMVAADGGVEFDELFSLCLTNDDAEIRECAVVALTGNGDSRLVAAFSGLLRNDPVEAVREKSVLALGAYADFAEAGRLSPHRLRRVRATLEDATDDASLRVAGAALIAYAALPDDSPTEQIESWCDRFGEDAVPMSFAFAAMGSSSERHWFPDVVQALDHPSALVRVSATVAFGQLANADDDLGYLEVQLDDDSLEVQMAAVTALGMIGTSDAREMLAVAIEDTPEPSVREAAESALRRLKDEDELRQAITPEMEESGLYGGGGTAVMRGRDIGRYDAPTEEGWGMVSGEDAEQDGDGGAGQSNEDEDIGEDLEDWYESEEFWRGMG